MDPLLFLYLSSSSSSESENENYDKYVRKQLRDQSNPLALSAKAFLKRFRMNKDMFNYILKKIHFKQQDTKAVPIILQIAATISLLVSGGYQQNIGNDYLFGMCQSAISKLTSRMLIEMEEQLCCEFIRFDPDDARECKKWFGEKYKIPEVVGCLDSTPIKLRKPAKDEHEYYNRNGFHSLNAMIICDHNYKILAVDCKYGGAFSDSHVWKHSKERYILKEHFTSNKNNISLLLADAAYPLEPWCITPYGPAEQGNSEHNFNIIHSKARRVIKRTIAMLKGRFGILACVGGRYDPTKVARFCNVCAALHNMCIKFKVNFNHKTYKAVAVSDTVNVEEDELTKIGKTIRDQIKDTLFKL